MSDLLAGIVFLFSAFAIVAVKSFWKQINKRIQHEFMGWWVFIAAVAIWTVWICFWRLGARPLHIDEAAYHYVAFSFYKCLFRGFSQGLYRYQPFFHSPLYFYLLIPSYALLGSSFFALRSPTALFGVLIVFTPLLFGRKASRPAIGLAILILAGSPLLTFASRLSRHETSFHFLIVLTVFWVFRFLRSRSVRDGLWAALSYTLMFCAKEDAYVFTVQLILFFALYGWKRMLDRDGFPSRAWNFFKSQREVWLKGFFIFFSIYTLLYTTFLTNWHGWVGGFLDGVPFYVAHTHSGMLKGNFLYYVRLLYLHEIFLLVFLAFCGTLICWRKHWLLPFWSLFLGLCGYFLWNSGACSELPGFFHQFHLYCVEDIIAVAVAVVAGTWLVLDGFFGDRGEVKPPLVHTFFYFWAMTSFLIYSYLDVKVPWLILHMEIPLVFVAMSAFDRLGLNRWWRDPRRRHWLIVPGVCLLAFSLRMDYRETLWGRFSERLTFGDWQWTYPNNVRQFSFDIEAYARSSSRNKAIRIQIVDEYGYLGWFAWGYLVDKFDDMVWVFGARKMDPLPDVIISDPNSAQRVASEMLPGSSGVAYHLQDARRIDFRNLDLKGLCAFYKHPEEFANVPVGALDAVVFFKSRHPSF